ncbi:MAG: GTPase ObgE [Nitrospiria bacterium]
MFIDQVKIYVKAGDGGDGAVSFRKEKFVPRGGPDGGDGGKGGDVILEASHNLSTLIDLRYQQHYVVKRAGHGSGHKSSGKDSADLTIPVPVGTVVRDDTSGDILADLNQADQQTIVAIGGSGGRGNTRFKSSIVQAPLHSEPGGIGEEYWLQLELKLLADVGLVGLPNAGKSSLLSTITKAHPKVADYPFTTLEPKLGVATVKGTYGRTDHFTIADVPGLIEGAHEGRGLGVQFLKHLERTSLLLHLVDISEMAEEDPTHVFEIIRDEVIHYHPEMSKKPFMVAGTKIDIRGEGHNEAALRSYCQKKRIPFFSISSATMQGMDALLRSLFFEVERSRKEAGKIFDSSSPSLNIASNEGSSRAQSPPLS